MKPIGGEIAIKSNNERSYLTDSGRSSLRLFLRSNNFDNQKFLIPNFFCSVIETILQQENITYDFYKVNEDFRIDKNDLKNKDFDVLYVINYFGFVSDLTSICLENKTLIEDNVFLYNFENFHNASKWFAFNSFRKISPLTDGSLIKTNLEIDFSLIINSSAPYSKLKQKACEIKYQFLSKDKFSEEEYLTLFNAGENKIDAQIDMYSISPEALNLLFKEDFNNQVVLKSRYNQLQQLTKSNKKEPLYFSFFTFNVKNKQSLLSELRNKKIFLPNFWPETTQNSELYTNLVAIPLFYNYTSSEFNFILNTLSLFLEND